MPASPLSMSRGRLIVTMGWTSQAAIGGAMDRQAAQDVVVVGGGPAGCVLASRLSEDPECRVLLLEAGPDYGSDLSDWPLPLRDANGACGDLHQWGYLHNRPAGGEPISLLRARMMGGTSAINGSVWLRGSAADYDGWEAMGNPGWGFADLLPYFRKAECDPLDETTGPAPIARVNPGDMTGVDRAFADSAQRLGFQWTDNLNASGAQSSGVGPSPKNIAGEVRMNGAFTYLAAARNRANLEILPDTHVDRVLIEEGRAVGVSTVAGREIAAREIVLAAGTYGSPAILLRSGIGPGSELRDLGIPVARDLPGVGQHLLDHPMAANGFCLHLIRPEAHPHRTSFIRLLIKARSSQVDEEIDPHLYLMTHFNESDGGWVLVIPTSLMLARSAGVVRLTSPDPEASLVIDHNYLADPADVEALCDGVELAARLVATPPLADCVLGPAPGSQSWSSRAELRALILAIADTTYHPSSTCRMGLAADPGAVVDRAGRVHGIAGLRDADASIFPTSPRANIHATVVAAAEKIADMMRAESAVT